MYNYARQANFSVPSNSKFLALLYSQNQNTQIFAPADAHPKAAGHLKGVGALKFAWFGLKLT